MDKDKDTNLEQEQPVEQVSNDDDFEKKLQEALNKHLEDLNKKIDAIGLDNKKLKQEKRSLEVTEELNRRGLDVVLYDVVFDNDPEITTSKINIIEEVLKKDVATRVQEEVNARFKKYSYIPPGKNGTGLSRGELFERIVRNNS